MTEVKVYPGAIAGRGLKVIKKVPQFYPDLSSRWRPGQQMESDSMWILARVPLSYVQIVPYELKV